MSKFFLWAAQQVRGAEYAFVTLIAAVIPWLVPLVPAYLTGYHVMVDLKLPEWAAWIIGIVLEGLGIASMNRVVAFWENNRRYIKETNKMPLLIPIATYVWYFAVVLVVNVLLEREAGASNTRLWAIGLLASLSLPTAALISVNAIWTERQLVRDNARSQAHAAANVPVNGSMNGSQVNPNEPVNGSANVHSEPVGAVNVQSSDREQFIDEYLSQILNAEGREASITEIAQAAGLDPYRHKGFISTKRKAWRERQNGNGGSA